MSDTEKLTAHQAGIQAVQEALPGIYENRNKLISFTMEGEDLKTSPRYREYMLDGISLDVIRLYGETSGNPITVSISRTLANLAEAYLNQKLTGIEGGPKPGDR